jgi:hypothetical protein
MVIDLSNVLTSFQKALRYDKRRNKRLRDYYINEALIFLIGL